MTVGQKIYNLSYKLRRISSLTYVPEIDGLRFLAIAMVVFAHLSDYLIYSPGGGGVGYYLSNYHWWVVVISNFAKGIPLSFVISGLFLSLPFARYYREEAPGQKVALGRYYLRRLTRIEPTYLITILSLFAFSLIIGQYVWPGDWRQLVTALTYSGNIFQLRNPIDWGVTWTLEIEMQFYCLVPILTNVFRLPKSGRRAAMIAAMVISVLASNYYPLPFVSIYSQLHYFLLGFLLTDLYLDRPVIKLPFLVSLGFGSAVFLLALLHPVDTPVSKSVWLCLLFASISLVLFDAHWRRIFSIRWLTVIGGMCYTIYLWHLPIIHFFGNMLTNWHWTDSRELWFISCAVVLLLLVLVFSTLLYLLAEKPFMRQDWPQRAWLKINNMIGFSKKTAGD